MIDSGYLRARDLTFTCLACRSRVTFNGPWHGPRVAAWTRAHRLPMLTGWTVELDTEHVSVVTVPVPPTVAVRP